MVKSARISKRLLLVSGFVSVGVILALVFTSLAIAKRFGEWGPPVNAELIPGTSPELNTPFNDGCPIQSPDGQSLFIASNRSGTLGGQDIWVAYRQGENGPWGTPENLLAPINSSFNDFCPTPPTSTSA